MSRWRRPAGLGALMVLGTVLAACSSGPGTGSSSTTSTTRPLGHTPSSSTPSTNVPETVPNEISARKDVAMQNCASTAGGWSAGGTVNNTLGHDATFHITVFFTSAQATDLAYGTTSVAVGSGQTKLWSVKASFTPPTQVLCVLRGVSTS